MTIRLSACAGCRNNFYNGPNALDGKRCWSAKDGRMTTRYKIHRDSMPAWKYAFEQVRVPDCYHADGFAHYKALPSFVKLDDVVRRKRVTP